MVYAPLVVPIRKPTTATGKLEISRLLGPSPNSPPRASQAPPGNRSTSVPTSTALYPLVTSPTPSTASQVSTATAPANLYARSQPQPQPQPERRTHGSSNSAAASLGPTRRPPPGPGKRPPPDKPHSSASPAKKQSKWTSTEDDDILQFRGTGMQWDRISDHLPGRSPTSCRLHYQNYLEKRYPWDDEKSDKLARVYERFKGQMWNIIGVELGIPWRVLEYKHWSLGRQEMASRAGVVPFSMIEPSESSTSSKVDHSRVPASTEISANSPGGIGSSTHGRRGLFGPSPSGEFPPLRSGFVDSREIGRRDDRGRRRRSEGGRDGRTPKLPGVAELAGGVGLYHDDDDNYDDDDEEEEEGEEEREEEDEEEEDDDEDGDEEDLEEEWKFKREKK